MGRTKELINPKTKKYKLITFCARKKNEINEDFWFNDSPADQCCGG